MLLFGYHIHRNPRPWDGAPAWAIELGEMVRSLQRKDYTIMKTLDEMLAETNATLDQAKKNSDLEDSIINVVNQNNANIKTLQDQLAAAGQDPAKLQALSDAMDALQAADIANGQKVADAVTANTPAAPPAPAA